VLRIFRSLTEVRMREQLNAHPGFTGTEQGESSLSVQSVWLKYETHVVNLGRLEHNSTSIPEVKHT
jgi:hypothetical protein